MKTELKQRMNKVSARSLDGNVVMGMAEWNAIVNLVSNILSEPVASMPQDVELNQILGEYLAEELAAVAPDIDWYDGRYMDGLVSGILDVVMAGHVKAKEVAAKEWNQAEGRDGKLYTDGWNACREAMLTASKESE